MADKDNNYGYGSVDLTAPISVNRNRNLNGLGSLYQYDQTPTVVQKDPNTMYMDNNVNLPEYNYGNLNNNNSSGGLWDSIKSAFTPNEKGTSLGGQIMSGIGTGVSALSSIGSLYFANENAKAQKDLQAYQKSRDAMADAKVAQMQNNYDKSRVG